MARNDMFTGYDTLDEARTMLRDAVAAIPGTALDLTTPCTEWTVAQVLQHAALDQLVWAAAVSGGAMPADNPFAPSGQVPDPVRFTSEALASSAGAWAEVPGLQLVPTPLPQGQLAPSVAVGAAALDAAIHAWDIAVATGQGSPLTPELARALRPAAEAIVEPLRQYGAYAAVVEVRDGGDAESLLAYLGRRPDWTA
jgi:uncharacterized protein (TIGR03086 family)